MTPRIRPSTAVRLAALVSASLLAACAGIGMPRQDSAAPENTQAAPAPPPLAPAHDPHLHAAPPSAPALPSPVVVRIDAASLASAPRTTVTLTAGGAARRCEGVALSVLLRGAGLLPADGLRGAALGRYVQVDGRDGFRALFALAEFDPTLGNREAFLVDRCDGRPIGDDDGPLRLLVPGDARAARGVRQVHAITVIVAP